MLNDPKTEAKSETKRLFSTPKQREALPDSGGRLWLQHSIRGAFFITLRVIGR